MAGMGAGSGGRLQDVCDAMTSMQADVFYVCEINDLASLTSELLLEILGV